MILTDEYIRMLINSLVEITQPEKIILFGSYAQGNAKDSSDIDLCVIKHTELPSRQRGKDVRIKLKERNGWYHPMDIIYYTPSEVEKLKDNPYTFINEIMNTGRVVYDKKG